ncbi:MAG: hypothetical protein KDB00_06015 [Planctomycetales bacterium]|nr:hypothetical protein [Planctomycetales bacterium]
MVYAKPRPGTDAASVLLNSQLIGDLVDMLNAYQSGAFNPPRPRLDVEGRLTLENTTGINIAAGEIQQIKPIAALPTSSGDAEFQWTYHENPNCEVIVPVWHTAIDNLIAFQTDVVAGEHYEHTHRYFGTVLATTVQATDRYVMPDPANPRVMRTADAGIWKILQQDGNGRCLVDFRQSQPYWRYKLTEESQAPGVTTAKLVRLDGTEFSATEINLSDPLSIGDSDLIDYEGYCIHAGNTFQIAPGPC